MDTLTPKGQILIYLLKAEFLCRVSFRGVSGLSDMIWHITNMLKTNVRQMFILQNNIVETAFSVLGIDSIMGPQPSKFCSYHFNKL